jgi:catechol 2,3-dioxygenase-like lactoylglutathione lyase family enzyme
MSAERATMLRVDHVQIAIPPGAEAACRAFYVGVLGMTELAQPAELAGRGGLWVRSGDVEIHLGVEQDFRPARKAHPGVLVRDIDALGARLRAAGYSPVWDDAISGLRRFFTADPLGNRLEFIAADESTICRE